MPPLLRGVHAPTLEHAKHTLMFCTPAGGTNPPAASREETLYHISNTQQALECMIEYRLQVVAEDGGEKR